MRLAELLVLCHGVRGGVRDWEAFHHALRQYPSTARLLVHVSRANEGQTLDGIEPGGRRLAQEVAEIVQKLMSDPSDPAAGVRVSFVAHSLGGLYVRACLVELRKRVGAELAWGHYYSLSTPHLGSRRGSNGGWRSNLMRSAVNYALATRMYGATGEDLRGATPILRELSRPGSPSMMEFGGFQSRTLVALVYMDYTVPYASASARSDDPYHNAELTTEPEDRFAVAGAWTFGPAESEATRLVSSFACPGALLRHLHDSPSPAVPVRQDSPPGSSAGEEAVDWQVDARHEVEYDPQVLAGLASVSTRRLDCIFGGPVGFHYHDLWLRKVGKGAEFFDLRGADRFHRFFIPFILSELDGYSSDRSGQHL